MGYHYRKYPLWYVDWVREHNAEYTCREMAAVSEELTGIPITYKALHALKKNNGIRAVKRDRKGQFSMTFNEEQEAFLREHAKGTSNEKLTELLNEHFGADFGKNQVIAWKKNHHVSSGLTGWFHTEENPIPDPGWRRGIPSTSKTKYRKGNRPWTTVPVGTRVKRDREYWWTKIAEPNVWKQDHILLWESVNGPVPEGCVLKFLDGDRDHITLENLRLVTRRVNHYMNTKGLHVNDRDMEEVSILYAETVLMAVKRRKELKGEKKK